MNRDKLRKYAKRAGMVGLAWLTLELLAGAAAVAFGANWLAR
jgi:hypothetical protein